MKMKYLKKAILFIVGVVLLFSYPADARRVKGNFLSHILEGIDLEVIQTALDEVVLSLTSQFTQQPEWNFEDALTEMQKDTTPKETCFLLTQKPGKEDLHLLAFQGTEEALKLADGTFEILVLYIPQADKWLLVKGMESVELPHNLNTILINGLITSAGHTHPGYYWPIGSVGDAEFVSLGGGFHYVIAEAGIGILNADNLINPKTGERWLEHINIKDIANINYMGTEEEQLADRLALYEQINLQYRFIPWEEVDEDTITPKIQSLVQNLSSTNEFIRVRALGHIYTMIRSKALPLLKAFSKDPSEHIRKTVVSSISILAMTYFKDSITEQEAFEVLHLFDADPSLKIRTATIAQAIGTAMEKNTQDERADEITAMIKNVLTDFNFFDAFSSLAGVHLSYNKTRFFMDAIEQINSKQLRDNLTLILQDHQSRERCEVYMAAHCLAYLNEQETNDLLIRKFQEEGEIKDIVAQALLLQNYQPAIEHFLNRIKLSLEESEASPYLLNLLIESTESEETLNSIRELIRPYWNHEYPNIRAHVVAETLGKIGTLDDLPLLEKMLADPNIFVGSSAEDAIAAIIKREYP
ncbi:MAG: HEAT repeat domain-containing protein [Candidatus Kaelpia imicola]|nr:HEAT repeat domain-containing protein [Candidatus Kaelpia imicola]